MTLGKGSSIGEKLDGLPEDVRARLDRFGFDRERLLYFSDRLRQGDIDNRVTARVEPPPPECIEHLPAPGSAGYRQLVEAGEALLREGSVAMVVLAGGMATRMGGVVKALVEALPGKTFLDLRLSALRSEASCFGKAPPLWFMTSPATDEALRAALGPRLGDPNVAVFPQYVSLRLNKDGSLFLDAAGRPSEHAPGHGDLVQALQESGLLDRFVAGGGRLVLIANLDNLGATLDPAVIGFHIEHGAPVTSEVVRKVGSDRGGVPVVVDGKLQALEEFRLPPDFDAASVRVFNINTFLVDAKALSELNMDFTYFAVDKSVEGQQVVQFERLINEITRALETRYVEVPREGAASRFLPVKDSEELARRREELRAVARARGMLE
jgi:UTP--glucose-1-phosphate uridylyltransferase